MFAFAGPAYLVSVGYMDPGNWATDLEGGARFGYQLLWVLVMSNAMAILLQTLSARLGIVTGKDLAQACREAYPRRISWLLWALCEIAIAACDLAEALGAAIGLKLLFGIPLLFGIILTAADTLLVLWFTRFGIRAIEAFILSLVSIIGVCFFLELTLARPDLGSLVTGLVPRLNGQNLYIAIGILGATVMPHNLYLHSALVQTRSIGRDEGSKRVACRYNLIDSVIALNGALLVNAAILVLSATVFFRRGIIVTEIQQAHLLLAPLLGTALASVAFAVALICSGQSSTVTGTMAGQIVMEGFLEFRMRPWLRRLVTRMLAVIPAILTILVAGEEGTYKLLILSQIVLSLQLPFAVIPLVHFTGNRSKMGPFANPRWVQALAWTAAAIIVALNLWLVSSTVKEWLQQAGEFRWLVELTAIPVAIGLFALLLWVWLEPILPQWLRGRAGVVRRVPEALQVPHATATYSKILVPLDHSDQDGPAVAHAASMARLSGATVYLVHVEEDVASQVYGDEASTAEIEAGRRYLTTIAEDLRTQGIRTELVIHHSTKPAEEIIRISSEIHPDLVVMGSHGHKGLKDLVLGTTINAVRHDLGVPLLLVRGKPKV
jgi:manganese transport protein